MNKQEALAYIESGKEAVQARTHRDVSTGEAVRLLGYGYRTPHRFEKRDTVEEFEYLRKDGTTGVLVEFLNPHRQAWQSRLGVVQLRQLFPITLDEAKAQYEEAQCEADRERERRHTQREEDRGYAQRLVDVLGAGHVHEPYTGVVKITLTLDEARMIAEQLSALVSSC